MQIAVIGAGNMGCVYGANLARIGEEVTMIDVAEDHVAAMCEHGLRMEGLHGEFTADVFATVDPSEAPKAAAEVITKLKEEMTQNMARDNDLLEERRRIMSDLDGMSDSLAKSTVNQGKAMETLLSSSGTMLAEISQRFDSKVEGEINKLSGIALQFSESSVDIASMSDAFVGAIERFSESNDKLVDNLTKIEAALEASTNRSDEQLAYYVAQAREIIDHSMMSQKGLIEEINQMAIERSDERTAKVSA